MEELREKYRDLSADQVFDLINNSNMHDDHDCWSWNIYIDKMEQEDNYLEEAKRVSKINISDFIKNGEINEIRKLTHKGYDVITSRSCRCCPGEYEGDIAFAFESKQFDIFKLLVENASFTSCYEFYWLLRDIEYPRHLSIEYRKILVSKLKQLILTKSIRATKNEIVECSYCCTGLDAEEGLDNFMKEHRRLIYYLK